MFLDEIRDELSSSIYILLRNAGVGSYDEMYALLSQFPSIAKNISIELPRWTSFSAVRSSASVKKSISSTGSSNKNKAPFSTGAFPPPRSLVGNGYEKPQPTSAAKLIAGLSHASIKNSMLNPVRDQGGRGTCVAHAVVACAEEIFSNSDLSEQFSYWGAKIHGHDPFPNDEGTWLRCAKNALSSVGICEEAFWPYNPTLMPNNETQAMAGIPTPKALRDGGNRVCSPSKYEDLSTVSSGKAIILADELKFGPVAVALPVFVDVITNDNNWTWYGGVSYGHVSDPIQYSVAKGGHAVCVNEFHPSKVAPGGGWFIFRNSWGTVNWNDGNTQCPTGHPACPAGYGYFSAEYADKFLWELLRV